MGPVVIGGSPGCGKTTLCKHMSQLEKSSVHLQTDHFFHFIAHLIDPSRPESKKQNEAVIDAYCRAANAFSESGYTVYVDGVIGPWHHSHLVSVLGSFHYILLHAPLSVTLARISQREDQSSAHPSVVERMHPQFESILEDFSDNLVSTDGLSVEALAPIVLSKIRSGRCVIGAA